MIGLTVRNNFIIKKKIYVSSYNRYVITRNGLLSNNDMTSQFIDG